MSGFGDDVPEDAYDPSGEPDPEQVARRLHELRSAMRVLHGGTPLPPWHLYPGRIAETVAITAAVNALNLSNANDFGQAIHEGRRALDALPAWNNLTEAQRELARALGGLLVVWLIAEGSLP